MSVYQRGKNTWRIQVDAGYNSNGIRIRQNETYKGSKKEALAREAKIKEETKSGAYIAKNNITYYMFIEKWWKEYALPTLAPKTLHGYKVMLKEINENLGFRKIKEIKPLHLIEFYNKLKNRGLGNNSVCHYYALNNSILNYAVKWEFIVSNPNHKVDKPKIPKKEVKHYNIEETKKLISCLENEKPKYKALILLALDTGARRGEITGLEWKDINFEEHCITINKTTQCVGRKIVEKLPKNDSSIRKVPITPITINTLKEYRKNQILLKQRLDNKWLNSKKVFTTNEGANMHPDTPSKIFRKIIKKYDLPKISFHGLRHTSVSLLIAAGIHTQVISKRVGHSSASTTQNIYSHVFDSVSNAVTDKLNNIFQN